MKPYPQFNDGDILIIVRHPHGLFLGDMVKGTDQSDKGLQGTWLTGPEAGKETGGFFHTKFRKATKLEKAMK